MITQGSALGTLGTFFWKHSATILTLAYVYTSALGVIYLYSLFRRFGINIMDFVGATDVLFAAFKAPLGAIVSLPVALGISASLISGPLAKRSFWQRISVLIAVPIALIIPPLIMGAVDGVRLRDVGGTKVIVHLKESGDPPVSNSVLGDTTLIWTTDDFAFFYSHDTLRMHFAPVSNIERIDTVPMQPLESSDTMLERILRGLRLSTPAEIEESRESDPTPTNYSP